MIKVWWRLSLDNRFKIGDWVIFLKDIKAGYEREHMLLIPAFQPCTIVKINSVHVTVDFKGTKEKLRYIPKRMAPAGDLAKVIYGN